MNVFLDKIDGIMSKAELSPAGGGAASDVAGLSSGMIPYAEIIMVAFTLIIFAYLVRFIEYVCFKLKV